MATTHASADARLIYCPVRSDSKEHRLYPGRLCERKVLSIASDRAPLLYMGEFIHEEIAVN